MPLEPSSAEQIFRDNYTYALLFASGITRDFGDAQEAVNDAGVILVEKEEAGERVSKALFFGIVRKKALNARRERTRRKKIGTLEIDINTKSGVDGNQQSFLDAFPDHSTPPPDDSASSNDNLALLDLLQEYLEKVYPPGAEVIRLHRIEDRSQAETAEELGISENTVKMRYRKACRLLRTRFLKEYKNTLD